jgi:hypothetical protein
LLVFTAAGLIGLLSLASLPTLWLTFRHPEGINIRKVRKTMEMVTLRTGKVVPKDLVTTTMALLESLMARDPITGFEFVCLCKDSTHNLWNDAGDILARASLIGQDGKIHKYVREITLAAAEGEGLDLRLVSPVVAKS